MSVIVPVGEAQIVLRWLSASDPEEQVSTLGSSGIGGFADAQALAASIAAAAVGTFTGAGDMVDGWTFVGCTVYRRQDGGGSEIGESVVNVTDTTSVAGLPTNCALLVRKRTALAGRANRGRMYLPAALIGEDQVDRNGLLSDAKRTSLQTALTNFFDTVNTALDTDELVLFHSDGSPSTPITALVLDNQIATQRKRMR